MDAELKIFRLQVLLSTHYRVQLNKNDNIFL